LPEKVSVFSIDGLDNFNTIEGVITPFFVSEHVTLLHMSMSPEMDVPIHAHKYTSVLFVLKGNLTLLLNDTHFHLIDGDIAVIPGGVEAGFKNPSSSNPVELFFVSSPSGIKTLDGLKDALRSFSQRSK
jgi:quercetin dioxygenase-like cupin family protein